MKKNLQVLELEFLLNISLILSENVEDILIYQNHDSIVVNENQQIIGLNLTGYQREDFSVLSLLKDIQYLNLTNNQISDISFLKDLDKLTHLQLSGNLISDISPLINLPNLQLLKIGHNDISNISALKSLQNLFYLEIGLNDINSYDELSFLRNLKNLDINSSRISNIEFLKNLKNLVSLDLTNNQISDLDPLSNLINLTVLKLAQNSITEIGVLKRLSKLEHLDLGRNYRIYDTSALYKLLNLEYLDLGANKIQNIDFVSHLTNLSYLDLQVNLIEDVYPIHNLVKLEYLSISTNEIFDAYPLKNLHSLKHLSLGMNSLVDISFLKELKELNYLSLGRNPISDFSSLKNLKQITSLYLNECNLVDISFLKGLNKLTTLDLGMNFINNFSGIENLKFLSSLDLSKNSISNVSFLSNLPTLNKLLLWDNKISDLRPISKLINLKELDLKRNEIMDISFVKELKELQKLVLANNKITEIECIEDLPKINNLDLSFNNISKISFKKNNETLVYLDLSNNFLEDTLFIKKIKRIIILNLDNNFIEDFKGFDFLKDLNRLIVRNNRISSITQFDFILNLPDLVINAANNPCLNNSHIILHEKENHYNTIANELKKLNDLQVKAVLPEKIVLLGNHASGKSSLLYYLQNKKLEYKEDSTHILKIENYPIKFEKLPKAIIYDFGGQDFYHGIYKTFLTTDTLTLLLWHTASNSCHFKLDSKKRPNRNFNVDYWIGQKKHKNILGEIILIQSYADDIENSIKKSYINKYSEIEDEVYVSLSNTNTETFNEKLNLSALKYLKDKLDDILDKKQRSKNSSGKISKPYYTFLLHILNSQKNHNCITKDELRKSYLLDEMWRYEEDLEQLHRQGLILIHNENIWLSPAELTKYVHEEILKKEYLNNGIIEKSLFEKKYFPNEIIDLLISQKVIFFHRFGVDNRYERQEEYIVPNYLPLLNNSEADFNLMTFGLENPLFVLKFDKFLPFGLINQMICYFGQLPDKKKFWRDFLIFTINKEVKVMIKLDLDNLEIKVYSQFIKSTSNDFKNNIEKYLFFSIMAMYWDFPAIPENLETFVERFRVIKTNTNMTSEMEFIDYSLYDFYNNFECRPKDLFISKDDKYFVNYKSLCSVDTNNTKMKTFQINSDRKLKEYKDMPFDIYQNFTHKNLRTMKKIFISYSRKDKKFKDDLKIQLKVLERYCVAKAWTCEEMNAGEWDEQIQNELNESDIIVYMISDNFLASDYIMDKEVNVGIEMVKNNPNKKIICVLVRECSWDSWQFLSDNFSGSGAVQNTLGKYQFIPWHIFNNKKDDEREELVSLEQWGREGYEVRSIAYKQIVSKILETIKQIS